MSAKTYADYQAAAAALHELADEIEQSGAKDYGEFLDETMASGDSDTIKRVRDLDRLAFSCEPDSKDVPDVLREAVSDNFFVLGGDNGRTGADHKAAAAVSLELAAEMKRTGAKTLGDLVEQTNASGDFDEMERVRQMVMAFVNTMSPNEPS